MSPRLIKFIFPFLIFLLIAALLWYGLGNNPSQIPSALIGKKIPNFSYANLLTSKQKITDKDFLGHITLLNVWATWCISCRVEHPILMDIANSKRVIIYGLDYKDEVNKAEDWLTNFGNPYQKIIFDPQGTLAINFGVYGTPETFIIDKQGIIRYKYIGPISPSAWQQEILPEINKLS